MIELDGGYGTGGGQILRTALGLSALTGKVCAIKHIRVQREQSGLREQHLQGALALADLCNAKYKGLVLGSDKVEFYPQEITKKKIDINIKTAGSVGLALQALMIPALHYDLEISINGGATFGRGAPPLYYVRDVFGYFLNKMGYHFELAVQKEGFFPKGGALVEFKSYKPNKLGSLAVVERTPVKTINGISVASETLRQRAVADRQAKKASELIYEYFKIKPEINILYSPCLGFGSGLSLWLETQNSRIGAGSFGRPARKIKGKLHRGISSEGLAKEVVEKGNEELGIKSLIWEYENGVVDSHVADQLLPYIALNGGSIKTSRISEHTKTNAFVIEKFLDVKFEINEKNKIISATI